MQLVFIEVVPFGIWINFPLSSVIPITENNGRFVQMPKAETMINANSKLLLVGSQSGIIRAKRILTLNKQPEDI